MTVSPRMPDLFNTESNSENEIKSRIAEEELTHHLTFYTNPMSRGRIARWMLEEVGVPYEVEILPFGPRMKQQDYRAINPMGKVPAIRHNDTVVTECAAICAYLADAFPSAGLAPAMADRGDYYRWMFFAAGPWRLRSPTGALASRYRRRNAG